MTFTNLSLIFLIKYRALHSNLTFFIVISTLYACGYLGRYTTSWSLRFDWLNLKHNVHEMFTSISHIWLHPCRKRLRFSNFNVLVISFNCTRICCFNPIGSWSVSYILLFANPQKTYSGIVRSGEQSGHCISLCCLGSILLSS